MRLAIISYTPTAEDLQRQAALELQERKKEIGIYEGGEILERVPNQKRIEIIKEKGD